MRNALKYSRSVDEANKYSIFLEEKGYNEILLMRWRDFRAARNLPLRKVAPHIGVSRTSLSTYENLNYAGDIKALERKLRGYLDAIESNKPRGEGAYKVTAFAELLWEAAQACLNDHKIGAIIGPSGSGKTALAHEIKRKEPRTVLITASPMLRSHTAILRAIAGEIGCGFGNLPSDEVMKRIIERLEHKRLIIIDESHLITWEAFETVRHIYDQAKGGAFLYLGSPRLYSEMKGDRRFLWDQILSRIQIRRTVGEVTFEDIKVLVGDVYGNLRKDALQFLYQVACQPGRLRVMFALLEDAGKIADHEGVPVSLEILKQVRSLNDF